MMWRKRSRPLASRLEQQGSTRRRWLLGSFRGLDRNRHQTTHAVAPLEAVAPGALGLDVAHFLREVGGPVLDLLVSLA